MVQNFYHENRPRVRDAAGILKGEAPLPLLPSCKPRVGVSLRPILPNDTEDILDVIGDRCNTNEAAYLTSRSHFD
ncbi:hypothetical protein QN277_011518 [Acacia crassicarpa]|uniref:Uncharacterized protein n=1 Tax=Acacia crassicarpa TaxID=499986 RepID=A0AAE1MYY8_9FABA|nr:hypothetical protein QN277_011518 [Acacia crassicarpa]